MKVSWLLKSSFKSTIITIIMTLLISACSAESSPTADNGSAGGIADPTNTGETTSNQPAKISGTDTGSVTEDIDPDGNNLLEVNGTLDITDSDAGEAAFIAATLNSEYGSLHLETNGDWFYSTNNNQSAIQNLSSNQTLTDGITVSSIDGTTHIVTITINGANEANTNPTNSAAIISGIDTGSVTEDVDPNGNNLLEVAGKLNITDSNTGEAAFIAKTIKGKFGNLSINTAGNWNYSADNSQSVIQNLNDTDTLSDAITVSSIDGTTHAIVITIIGVKEANTSIANVTLSWIAPAEREDNTAIALSEIAGYKIYYGTMQGNYTNSIDVNDSTTTSYIFSNLPTGSYYFVITTRDVNSRESQYSVEATITI